jgi:hypothetical protein
MLTRTFADCKHAKQKSGIFGARRLDAALDWNRQQSKAVSSHRTPQGHRTPATSKHAKVDKQSQLSSQMHKSRRDPTHR